METPNLVPLSIDANSRIELTEKMLEINLATKAYHRFFDIQQEGGRWVAWMYAEIKLDDRINVNGK